MRFLYDGEGIGGRIKAMPEDFIVREVVGNGKVLNVDEKVSPGMLGMEEKPDGKFAAFVLQKYNWDTVNALRTISKRLGRGRKSISYFGVKDKISLSVQIAAIYGVEPSALGGIRIKDISINGAWKSDEILMGGNLGNSFSVIVRDCAGREEAARVAAGLNGRMLNYFDRQRFGNRLNNAAVGLKIMNSDFKGAVMEFLCGGKDSDPEAAEARGRLAGEMDFARALEYFPRYLRNERAVIEYMARYGNYANALRKIHRGISLMFIHAVEALVFNYSLERCAERGSFEWAYYCGRNFYGFPDVSVDGSRNDGFPIGNIIGYETARGRISADEHYALESLGIMPESFRIKSMPELSMKGTGRALVAPVKDLHAAEEGEGACRLEFTLPPGSYATMLLREFTRDLGMDTERMIRDTGAAVALGTV